MEIKIEDADMLGDMAEDQKVGLLKIRPASSVRIITEFIKNGFHY